MRKYLMVLFIIMGTSPLLATGIDFHAGASSSVGFFSWYSTMQSGVSIELSERVSLGIVQRFSYGHSFGETMGTSEIRAYLFDDLFFHLGLSYLLQPAPALEKDFSVAILPVLGFGLYLPLDVKRTIFLVPMLEMNQSFYLSDSIRPLYQDLPFPIAGQVSVALEYRIGT
jgi:hypothetical protein